MRAVQALALSAVALCVATTSSRASAQEAECPLEAIGCLSQDLSFTTAIPIADLFDLDTDWVPGGSPVQVRFGASLGGESTVSMTPRALVMWPDPLTVNLSGTPTDGRLQIEYGYELIARVRIDIDEEIDLFITEIPIRINAEIDLTQFLPSELPPSLGLRGTTEFQPFSLQQEVMAEDSTPRLTVLDLNLVPLIPGIGSILSALDAVGLGVSAGLRAQIDAHMEAHYQTTSMSVTDVETSTTTTPTTDPVSMLLGPLTGGDFGGRRDLVADVTGQVRYDGAIRFYPVVYIDIARIIRPSWDITQIPIPVVSDGSAVDFDAVRIDVPLPNIGALPAEIDFGVLESGMMTTRTLTLVNNGQGPLWVRSERQRGAFDIAGIDQVIPPGEQIELVATYRASGSGTDVAVVVFETNDPDQPVIEVTLFAEAEQPPPTMPDAGTMPLADGSIPTGDGGPIMPGDGGWPTGDGSVPDAGPRADAGPRRGNQLDAGCACAVGSRAPGHRAVLLGAAVMLALALRRRRRG